MIITAGRLWMGWDHVGPCGTHDAFGDVPRSLPKESGLVAFDEDGWKDDLASPTAVHEDASPAAPMPELPESLMGEA